MAAASKKHGSGGRDPDESGVNLALDNVFSSQRPLFSLSANVWSPPSDVYETPDSVVVKIEIAGAHRDQLEITVENDILTVRGSREEGPASEKRDFHLMETHYGRFERVFRLPMGKLRAEDVQAQYQCGFLIVTIPKKPSESRDIPIQMEGE